MKESEHKQFVGCMMGLAASLAGKDAPSEMTIVEWIYDFSEYDFRDIKAAVSSARKELTYFPVPAEIIRRVELAKKARQDTEINAALESRWSVIRAAIKAGTCEALEDTSAGWAAKCCGGWKRVYGHYRAKDWEALKVFRDAFFNRIRADIVRQVKQLPAPDCRAELGFDDQPGKLDHRPSPHMAAGRPQMPHKQTFPGNAACGMDALKKMANRGQWQPMPK